MIHQSLDKEGNKIRVPPKAFYKKYLRQFSQYSKSRQFIDWCSAIAPFRGIRAVKLLSQFKPKSAKVLDLGCGIGLTLHILAQEFPNTVGCDIDERALKATRKLLVRVGLKTKLVFYDGEKLPFRSSSFDAVTSLEVIEHAENPVLMLKEIARILKTDGILIITTANKWWPYEPHFKLLFLSYLPGKLSDFYLKVSGRGESYQDIKLPSYRNFRRMVEKIFFVEDVTLSVIKDYKRYSIDKERGVKVVLVGNFLKWIDKLEQIPLFNKVPDFINWLLIRLSLGWIFIGRPKK